MKVKKCVFAPTNGGPHRFLIFLDFFFQYKFHRDQSTTCGILHEFGRGQSQRFHEFNDGQSERRMMQLLWGDHNSNFFFFHPLFIPIAVVCTISVENYC